MYIVPSSSLVGATEAKIFRNVLKSKSLILYRKVN